MSISLCVGRTAWRRFEDGCARHEPESRREPAGDQEIPQDTEYITVVRTVCEDDDATDDHGEYFEAQEDGEESIAEVQFVHRELLVRLSTQSVYVSPMDGKKALC